MHYFGEKMHKTKVFLHKSTKYPKRLEPAFLFCVKMYTLSIKIHKEKE